MRDFYILWQKFCMGLTASFQKFFKLFLGDGRKGNSDLETSFLLHFLYVGDDKSLVQMVQHPRH